MEKKVVCVVGATASGKTALAVKLAQKFNGEIISADSRQIYKGLDIGTGKDLKEYGDIKYHLIDICEPGERFTVFGWINLARKMIDDITGRGKLPIVVGGTGLYIQALVEGFEQKPKKSKIQHPKSKMFSRGELEKKSLPDLQKIYSKLKIRNSKLDFKNPRRLIRAIERAQQGTLISKHKPDFEVLQIGISLSRQILYDKIDKRIDNWFEQGMVEEIGKLLDSGIDADWLIGLGLQYKIIGSYLRQMKKDTSESDTSYRIPDTQLQLLGQRLKFKTHAYARRQLTWFRRFPEIIWAEKLTSAEKAIGDFLQ